MIPAYYTLIATFIGGILALTGQYFSSVLTTRREQKKTIQELVAEERRLAYLISQYYSVYIGEIVLSTFIMRFGAIEFEKNNTVDNSELYKTGNLALDRAQEIDEKIRLANASYFKAITHFTNLTGEREVIISLFDRLKLLQNPKPDFSKCQNLVELQETREKETKRLNEDFRHYPETYNKIFEEMKKSIKLKT